MSADVDWSAAACATPGAPSAAVLEARRVSAGYGPQPVIHDVDLVVQPGEVVGLLGRQRCRQDDHAADARRSSCRCSPGEVLLDGTVDHGPAAPARPRRA